MHGVIEMVALQWMTAGRGIIHSEKPEQEAGYGRCQLWVNLPGQPENDRHRDIRKKRPVRSR